MNAPKRWLDEPGTVTPAERDLLQAGLTIEPPPGSQAQGWAALVAQLPPTGGGAPTGGSAPTAGAKAAAAKAGASGASAGAGTGAVAGAVGGGILKSALIGAGSAVALIAGYAAVTSTRADPPSPPPAITAPAAPSPRATAGGEPVLAPPPAPDATLAPSAATAAPRPVEARSPGGAALAESPAGKAELAAERESRLREESQRLAEARDALRRGDAASALTDLEDLGRRFPDGVLVQEREALTIEALYRSGQRERATARARAFLSAYPTSPHASRLQAFTQ